MFYDNLKAACEKNQTSVTALLKKFGISTSNGTAWKNGTVPSSDIIVRFSEFLNITTDYLLTGKEKSSQLSSDEQELLKYYKKIPEREQMKLIGRAEALAEMYEEQAEEPQVRTITISCSDNRVSAGFGDELFDYEQWSTIDVVETTQSRKADFILIVDGDSMQPKFNDGDYILVHKQPAVYPGEIGIFDVDGKGYVKRYEGNRLISLNPKYDDIELDGKECICFGLVLGVAELI